MTPVCTFCGKTYEEHRDSGPDARMMCLGKKANFLPRDERPDSTGSVREIDHAAAYDFAKSKRHWRDKDGNLARAYLATRALLEDIERRVGEALKETE